MVHCSGLGGGLLSPDHDYDLFFQNHAQMKVYGPSLAMIDDWEQRVTQLGLTKTTMNMWYTNSLLLRWGDECGESLCQLNSQIISYCSLELCAYGQRPQSVPRMHDRRIQLGCPQGKILLLRASFPHLVQMPVPEGSREIDILDFLAGSYTGLAVHEVLTQFACFLGTTKVAALLPA